MITEEERVDQIFSEFAEKGDALFLKSTDWARSFAEVVEDYRRAEVEYVARMGDSAFGILEIKRRIAEWILWAAQRRHPHFEVCCEAWNDLVRVGFTNIERECTMTSFYVDCCAYDELPEEGLAVLEPLLAEIERRLEEARATQSPMEFYEEELEKLGDLRDELEAQRRGHMSPGRITRRMDEAYQPTPEKERIDELDDAFWEARRPIFKTFARSLDRSFAEVAADYRRVEADIVARAGEGEAYNAFVLKVRQNIAEDILTAAYWLKQPFEVCREAWNEVVRLGSTSCSEQCFNTNRYAESCVFNQKPEEGLAVVEALLAELERRLDAELERRRTKGEPPTHKEPSPRFYRGWIRSMGELRDKLEAQRKGGEPSA